MEIEATLRIPGPVLLTNDRIDARRAGPVVVDGRSRLWIEGRLVGRVLTVRPEGERHYEAGNPVPVAFTVIETQVDCVLDFHEPVDEGGAL